MDYVRVKKKIFMKIMEFAIQEYSDPVDIFSFLQRRLQQLLGNQDMNYSRVIILSLGSTVESLMKFS